MKCYIQRATTRGYKYYYDEEELEHEEPPCAGAQRATDVTIGCWNYHPWYIEVDSLETLFELSDQHGLIIGKTDEDEHPDKYPYTLTIYDGYME